MGKSRCKTTLDALNYLEKQKQKSETKADSKTKYTKNKKVVQIPDWYEEYEKQLENLPKKEKMSEEEINKILAEAKEKL